MTNKITEHVFQNRESIRMSRADFDDYITQEKERCAKVVLSMEGIYGAYPDRASLHEIAQAIRKP